VRIAIVSDIHGNRTAFEAVRADLRQVSPDLILHGGDLADSGSSPTHIIDAIHDLGWRGVLGNTDEMLIRPKSLEDFAAQSSAPPSLWSKVREIADATRVELGPDRLRWLETLPLVLYEDTFALVHASPETCWTSPNQDSTDEELEAVFSTLERQIVVFGHIHVPFVRNLSRHRGLVINTGSVGLPFDGDPSASYLLLENGTPSIRRVEYDLEEELKLISTSNLPGASWTTKTLRASAPQLP
jgi:putative phosphoesterase